MEKAMDPSEKPLSLEDVFVSYESRVQEFSGLIETTQELLLDSQESLSDLKDEQERVHGQLRDTLAANGSLRRADFTRMMQDLQREQRERELEVRSLLKDYLDEQKMLAAKLTEHLRQFREALGRQESIRLTQFQEFIGQVRQRQEQRKEEVRAQLRRVQSEEGRVIHSLQELLARGRDLRIKDLKQMLDQFQQERESRQAQAGERREEIQRKLQSYRLARSHGAQPIPPSGTARISMKEE
jgi:uncharacterized protein YPO0396